MRYADYILYEEAVADMPGLHINFEDLFDTPIENLSEKISDFIGVGTPKCNLREESYDMYGKIVPYDKAFVRFDDNIHFISPIVQEYFKNIVENNKIQKKPYNFFAWLLYLKEMTKYRLVN